MRVALCISGQPRNAEKTIESIKKYIIEPNDADVFIHSWFDEKDLEFEKIDLLRAGQNKFADGLDKWLVNEYNPKNHIIEPQIDFRHMKITVPEKMIIHYSNMNKHALHTKEDVSKHIIQQNASMFYSIYKCNQLKEEYAVKHGFTYDCVIRIRFDLLPNILIDCEKMDMNKIYYLNLNQPDDLISDWFNMGSSEIMNVYSSIFCNLEYLNKYKYFTKDKRQGVGLWDDANYLWGNEYLVRDMIQLYNIPRCRINTSFSLVY